MRALGVTGATASMLISGRLGVRATHAYQAMLETADELVIDMTGGPDHLDPALTRSSRDWTILHSIYDALVQIGPEGDLVPLAAERFEAVDDLTYEVALRSGLVFHDGSPVTADAIARSITHVQQSEGPAARNFAVVASVDLVDDLTARIVTKEPAPWLPSQLAVWAVLFPEGMTTETFETAPVGSGPFRFESREAGSEIVLVRNPGYTWASPKGAALAERIRFRVVPDSATRVADLATGTANLIVDVPPEQREEVERSGGTIEEAAILGTLFLRIATDAPPFNDPRVCRAINHAVDVSAIAQSLVGAESRRLASLYPDPRSIGFDPELAPFTFDPDAARALLAEAGHADGFDVRLQFAGGERDDILQAMAAQLGDVGIKVSIESLDLATFNGTWTEPDSAPLRLVSWRPVYDPHTLLSLMFASTGPLSRHNDPRADQLIRAAGTEADPPRRAELYRELGRYFQEAPPALFLWNLTSVYGVRDFGTGWSPRGDDYVIPTSTEEQRG
jgi:peptide/nickel transport system substrate-binding protein